MKASPLTLREIKFSKIQVEIDPSVRMKAEDYDFDDALIGCNINHGPMKNDPNTWWIGFAFANRNDGVDTKKCPYLFEFQAIGIVSVDPSWENDNKEKHVFETGSAMIYSAIREMTVNLTSRSIPGPLMLPTPTFLGSYEEHQEKNARKKKAKSKGVKE
jgi:preprotein translocase subunit SecB